jgi:hypothetical protein
MRLTKRALISHRVPVKAALRAFGRAARAPSDRGEVYASGKADIFPIEGDRSEGSQQTQEGMART